MSESIGERRALRPNAGAFAQRYLHAPFDEPAFGAIQCLGVLSLSPSFMKEEADMPNKTKTNGSGVPERDTPPVSERGRGPFCGESGQARAPHVLLDRNYSPMLSTARPARAI